MKKRKQSGVDAATGAAAPSLVEQLVEALEKIAKQKSDVDAAAGAAASQDTARIDALESFVNKHNDMDPEAFEDLTVSDLAQLEQGFNFLACFTYPQKSDVDAASGASAPSLVEELVDALKDCMLKCCGLHRRKSPEYRRWKAALAKGKAAATGAPSLDSARIDALESFVNKHGALVIHTGGVDCHGMLGLGLRPGYIRTMREALDVLVKPIAPCGPIGTMREALDALEPASPPC